VGWIETYSAKLLRQAPSTRRRDHLTTTHRGAVLEVDFHKRRIRIARCRVSVNKKRHKKRQKKTKKEVHARD
jgi:hypothetical protein